MIARTFYCHQPTKDGKAYALQIIDLGSFLLLISIVVLMSFFAVDHGVRFIILLQKEYFCSAPNFVIMS
jgi:hypothetical protein